MTPMTKAQIEAMLADATPDWLVYGEPEVGLPSGLFAGKIVDGIVPLEPLQGADLNLAAAAPDLARTAIALHDRVAELEGVLRAEHAYWKAKSDDDWEMMNMRDRVAEYPLPRKMTEAMEKADALTATLERTTP